MSEKLIKESRSYRWVFYCESIMNGGSVAKAIHNLKLESAADPDSTGDLLVALEEKMELVVN
ncbi:MAG TPA: hypothetical protein VHO84_02335 [Syntrophorhabdaceae bacterium]|nr:hypothetical protein [Syntrophorhabdaceae bacterium]